MHLQRELPDRAAAADRDTVADPDAGLVGDAHRDRGRLEQAALQQGHVIGQRVDLRLVPRDRLGHAGAVVVLDVLAELLLPCLARRGRCRRSAGSCRPPGRRRADRCGARAAPSASMTPESSWPSPIGTSVPKNPSARCGSDPQIAEYATRMRTSSGPRSGSGKSTSPMTPRVVSSGSRRLPILVTATVLIRLSVERAGRDGREASVAGGDDPAGRGDRGGEAVAVLVAQLFVVAEAGVDLRDAETLERRSDGCRDRRSRRRSREASPP